MPPRTSISRRREAAQSEYDCAICLSVPDFEVHQCRNGHLYCGTCLREHQRSSSACPVCRVALTADPIRCMVAERLIAEVPGNCRFCVAAMARGDIRAHELVCPDRRVACVAAAEGCQWTGGASDDRLSHEQECPHAIAHRLLVPLVDEIAVLKKQVASQTELSLDCISGPQDGDLLLAPGNVWRANGEGSGEDSIFVTVGLPQARLASGAWYYEVEILATVTCPQFGWAREGFRAGGESGCGDDVDSWAIDGDRLCYWHDGAEEVSIGEWRVGDVVSCLLHVDDNYVVFLLNGAAVYAVELDEQPDELQEPRRSAPFYPAMSMTKGCVRVNFGQDRPFAFPKAYRSTFHQVPADFQKALPVAHFPVYPERRGLRRIDALVDESRYESD
ncbi:hypothetical protein M885DRAFT_585853 [Pelagophyceae sp. CCMP2097]|nr:hypothetical protein M885DRAFT_585853 [Pelagophyceae sp. CCMP2097]